MDDGQPEGETKKAYSRLSPAASALPLGVEQSRGMADLGQGPAQLGCDPFWGSPINIVDSQWLVPGISRLL